MSAKRRGLPVRGLMWWLLACGAMLPTGQATAQPHVQRTGEDVTVPTPPVDEWLQRLVGHYRFEGVINVSARGDCPGPFCEVIKGTGDCVAVGKGPGVQCILAVSWLDIYEIIQPGEDPSEPAGVFNVPGGVAYLDPAMALHGIDPATSTISYLVVDNKGLPEGGKGQVRGNRGTFRSSCVNAPALFSAMKPVRREPAYRTCDRIIRIDAKPDATLLFMIIDIEINDEPFTSLTLSLRREEKADVGGKPVAR